MTKYSEEFYLKVVKEYLEGPLGYRLLAKKYGIPNTSQIQRWVKSYQAFGEDGLRKKRSPATYPFKFKLDVLNFMKQTGASYQDTAIKFKLNNPSLIVRWNQIFLQKGLEGLKGKGCLSMPKSKKSKSKKQLKDDMISREQLERENELLRIEIAYLKKLKAFQGNPDAYLEKHKQRWHSNSKNKDSN